MKATLIHILSIGALLVACISCSGTDKPQPPRRMEFAAKHSELPFPKQIADTMVDAYAYLMAYDKLREIDTLSTPFDKKAFLRGIDIVIADSASSAAYSQGAQSAMSIMGQIKELESKGVRVNIPLLIKGLREGLNTDSVTTRQVSEASSVYNGILVRALRH